MGDRVTVLVFAVELQNSAHQMHFLRVLREDWDEFQNRMYVKEGRKYTEFTSRYHI